MFSFPDYGCNAGKIGQLKPVIMAQRHICFLTQWHSAINLSLIDGCHGGGWRGRKGAGHEFRKSDDRGCFRFVHSIDKADLSCCIEWGAPECVWKPVKRSLMDLLIWSLGRIRCVGRRVSVRVRSHVLPLEHQLWVQGSQSQGQFFVGTTVQDAFQKKIGRYAQPVRERRDEKDAGCTVAAFDLV